ncbi:hypothetical protein [Yeosuana sp.]|uniref:hypothetical protein n=1 Tax=Yeosuana sp. TaxID=2529388 RepID=UPI004054BA43
MENNLKCPKCNSENLSADKKGFSGKKAVIGAIATGGIGILAGTIGSNKMMITCLNCGIKYKATDYISEKNKYDREREFNKKVAKGEVSNIPMYVFAFCLIIFGIWASVSLISNDWNILGSIFSIATGVLILFVGILLKGEYDDNKYKEKYFNKKKSELE